jgi:hypothetical protein
MGTKSGTWLLVLVALGAPACDDEILTDVDLPKDAAADRASDAPKEGAAGDAAAKDAGPDENTTTYDGATAEGGDSGTQNDSTTNDATGADAEPDGD